MPSIFDRNPDLELKLICVLCYLSGGIIGLIYYLFNGRHRNSMFFKFHFYQAMFLGIIMMLLSMGGGSLMSIISGLLGMFGSVTAGITGTVVTVISMAMAGITLVFNLCLLAGVVQSIRGRYLALPWISPMVRSRM